MLRRRCSPRRCPAGRSSHTPAAAAPSRVRSSRFVDSHGSSARGVGRYPRTATPYTVCWCHCRPSILPTGDRAPSATITSRQATSAPEASRSDVSRPRESHSVSTTFEPSRIRQPASTATCRTRSSSSVRGTALPYAGKDGPGQSISTSLPNPVSRSPRCLMCASSQSPRPSRCNSATARGVNPSPHGLSRGKSAASMTSTSRPSRAAHAAAADPAGPAPMTTRSALTLSGSSRPRRLSRSSRPRASTLPSMLDG